MLQETIGILFDSRMYRGIPARRTGQESLANVEQAAACYGLIPCFLRLEDVDSDNKTCMAYVKKEGIYVRQRMPLPSVIHNRALQLRRTEQHQVTQLLLQGIQVYNVRNRYRKDHIHEMLYQDPGLRQHLPRAVKATPDSLAYMMEHYDDLVIKPCSGSIGHGIMRIFQKDGQWKLTCETRTSRKGWATFRLNKGQLPSATLRRIFRHAYLIEERIPLVRYEGRPVDLRVSVQRGGDGLWGITGIFAKVAPAHTFVTNIAQGSKVMTLAEALGSEESDWHLLELEDRIKSVGLRIARTLASSLPHLADLGLDMGITEKRRIYFIECNGRDQRYGFRKAGMTEHWKASYRQPMAYGRLLLEQNSRIPRQPQTYDRSLY
ncbi:MULTISPECIES: YheC/YheD family endospore coat-associated protein [Paenibacillus]|uniref:YheC/YheD family endospore coat-associated protein n=1 Tax=Paenibacillus TaxID=44249 RepID=UPI000420FE6F|nr:MULTISPECIES: YheC/YheD family protein [Paenibacillus]KGP79691.1 endospore coat-associated protein yheD [Paenibacillus sp. MAEPY2]KGP84123.1 endospore coat-associated protein yheD [Paenibacillus sp. MAEPY1]OZQ69002.1 endospore coat-associated protein yheD [Paenibacillus taichungensis]HBU80932.1 endospore coat-associated protein yheD [Paenibacillus sp.]